VREAVEVFGTDRVMFGTDYGPVAARSQGTHRHRQCTGDLRGRQGENPVAQRRAVFQFGRRPEHDVDPAMI
jgi:predicted TIM-barrel fold metal-dependent hydrolase